MYATQIVCNALSDKAVANTLVTVAARAARAHVASSRHITDARLTVRVGQPSATGDVPQIPRRQAEGWVYEGGSGDDVA